VKKDKTNNLFYISLSNDWADQTCHTFTGPDIDNFRHNLIVTCETKIDKTHNLESLARIRIEHLRQNLQGIEILKSEEKKLPSSGRTAFEVVYKYTPDRGSTIYQKQVYILDNKKLFTFTASFLKETLGTIGSQVDEIVDSFKPL
jgi:hypothetical protein